MDPMGIDTIKYIDMQRPLVEKCQSGDRRSQFELYKRYYKVMYNVSLRIVKNRTDAEDIMQEGFISAFEKIHTFSGQVSFGAWLKRIVINKSIDFVKKKHYLLVPIEDEYMEKIDEAEKDVSFINVLELEKVKRVIASLPEGYRIVMTLYLMEGYDHEEIGEILNISSSSSRSQYTRARKKVLELLEKEKKYGKLTRIS